MAFTPTDATKAEVRITGTAPNQGLDFYIPRGAKGDPGGIVTGTVIGTTDLNTITGSGTYRAGADPIAGQNFPVLTMGTLLVYVSSTSGGGYIVQEFTPINVGILGRVFYRRVQVGGTWQPWRAFNSTRVDQTAGRAAYIWDDLNAREQLIYGDTGWRSVDADIVTAWKGVGSTMSIRRELNRVTVMCNINPNPADVTPATSNFYAIPAGFQPVYSGSQIDAVFYCEAATGVTPIPIILRNNGSSLDFLVSGRAPANIKFARGSASWITGNAWPTSLPGTAQGTIPNL